MILALLFEKKTYICFESGNKVPLLAVAGLPAKALAACLDITRCIYVANPSRAVPPPPGAGRFLFSCLELV